MRRVLSNGQPLSDAAGRSLGAVIAMRDVTEEERAREAAERAHRQLVEAIESLSEGFALFDENDRLVICNAKYREIYRDTGEPLQPGSTFEDIIRAGIERGQYAEAAGREEDFVRERVASHRNPPGTPIEQPLGDGRWVRIQERRTHGGGIVGIRTDITELKEREAALRESEERWRTLVETHPNPVLLQSDFRVLYANNAALDVYGAEHAEDLIGRNLLDFLEPEYREHVQERMTSISRGEHLPPRDYRIVRLDGAKRYVEAYSVPTAFRGQTVIQTIFWDVTERRRMEAQLQTARLKMVEARETERVHIARELHDGVMQQLLGVSYASAELERRIGRVPQLAGDASLPADMRAYRQELLQAVAQLRSVLKGLRPAGLEELGLGAALQDFVGALERSGGAGAPTFELDVRFEGPLPDLVGLTLFRVAQEATRNALKHAAATTVTIRAWQDDGGVHLVVADDGRGFTVPEQVTHLARDDHFGLVGLQEYVQAVRGTLAIRSAPRAGTSIVVTIPARAT